MRFVLMNFEAASAKQMRLLFRGVSSKRVGWYVDKTSNRLCCNDACLFDPLRYVFLGYSVEY